MVASTRPRSLITYLAVSFIECLPSSLVQGQLEELERELLETNGNAERLARSYNELVELQLVLERAGSFFDETRGRASAAAFESRPATSDGAHYSYLYRVFTKV